MKEEFIVFPSSYKPAGPARGPDCLMCSPNGLYHYRFRGRGNFVARRHVVAFVTGFACAALFCQKNFLPCQSCPICPLCAHIGTKLFSMGKNGQI